MKVEDLCFGVNAQQLLKLALISLNYEDNETGNFILLNYIRKEMEQQGTFNINDPELEQKMTKRSETLLVEFALETLNQKGLLETSIGPDGEFTYSILTGGKGA